MSRWDSYLYVYLIGGGVFAASLVLAWVKGALTSRRLLWLLLGGLGVYALAHGLLQLAGTPGAVPLTGKARGAEGYVGTTLDLVVVGVYFVGILGLGAYFARFTRTSSDFFFGGRRFSGWLIAVSCVATTVGSYSFIKYASAGYRFGLSSSMSYLNDWFWMPLWMLVWLPIIYYGRVQSVPEWFERRFSRPARVAATVILLVYLVGYVGINFLTLGKAINALTGWHVFWAACLAAGATGIYVAVGGQTSVIMTDLVQGLLLLGVGIGLFVVGISHLGGFENFWGGLPESHRTGFAGLNEPAAFHTMGIFWQDALAGGVAFYFMNQGILMRFMAARSVKEGRKAMGMVVLLVMPLAAIAVSGVGWIGRAMTSADQLDPMTDPDNVFVLVSAALSTPGVFGLIMATLTAALMSTADTLLTAVSAVFVNDIWRPLRAYLGRPPDDRSDLRAARAATIGTALLGVALVPLFLQFDSVYLAHATFVAAIVPPMAVAIVLGVAWKRFGPKAALVTLIGGSLAMALSMIFPELVEPFAQGAEAGGEGLKAHKYMRACYGVVVSGALGVISAFLFDRKAKAPDAAVVVGEESKLQAGFKGAPPKDAGPRIELTVVAVDEEPRSLEGTDEVLLRLHPDDRAALGAAGRDLLHVAAPSWWHGGLRSLHARIDEDEGNVSEMEAGRLPLPRALLRPSGLRDGGTVVVTLEG